MLGSYLDVTCYMENLTFSCGELRETIWFFGGISDTSGNGTETPTLVLNLNWNWKLKGNSDCNCSAVICEQGIMWHGGQGGPTAEQVKLAGSRDAGGEGLPVREWSLPCWWDKKCHSIHCLVAIDPGMGALEATVGKQSWHWGMNRTPG